MERENLSSSVILDFAESFLKEDNVPAKMMIE